MATTTKIRMENGIGKGQLGVGTACRNIAVGKKGSANIARKLQQGATVSQTHNGGRAGKKREVMWQRLCAARDCSEHWEARLNRVNCGRVFAVRSQSPTFHWSCVYTARESRGDG